MKKPSDKAADPKLRWRFLNKSVQGANHVRKNVQCQDYSLCSLGMGATLPMLLAVSDGHGGSRYVRSAQGAVYACETAIETLGEYASNVFAGADLSLIKQISETRIKLDIVKRWQELVFSHAEKNPFTDDELELLGITRALYEQAVDSDDLSEKECILTAYGTTLITAMVLEKTIICLQIGDGDILFYYKAREQGTVSPIPQDDQLIGNETTSLCSLKAPFHFRFGMTYLHDEADVPDLLMLATDGYANSFKSAQDYLKTAGDYHALLETEGAAFVEENVENWLRETSQEGSGDDITIVAAWRI